ncbi:MAG TPA: protein-disulfide reductase DsbD domain-containing protein [Candidatus Angelobacter sp.]|nr:protein-disulfide reductase DsbD domain-containing protein [Candidatus Angelobacter sp.]
MRKTTFLTLVVIMLLRAGTSAQTPGREFVTVDPVDPVTVRMGSSAPMQITLHVQPGYHINSNKPLTEELIPTQIHFTPPEDLVIAKVQYPAGVLTSFPFDPTTKLSVYSGNVTVKAAVLPAPKAGAGTYTVHAEVKYQACDNNACYPPKRVPVAFDVKITSSSSKLPKAKPTRTSPHIHN